MGIVQVEKSDLERIWDSLSAHREEHDARWREVEGALKQNLQAQENNAKSIEELKQNTEGVVQLYNDLQGAARVGLGLQKFTLWLAKWGTGGTILAAAIHYLVEMFSP